MLVNSMQKRKKEAAIMRPPFALQSVPVLMRHQLHRLQKQLFLNQTIVLFVFLIHSIQIEIFVRRQRA